MSRHGHLVLFEMPCSCRRHRSPFTPTSFLPDPPGCLRFRTNRFCVLPNTHPGTSWLNRPMTTIPTSELEFSFQMLPSFMGVETLWWETFSNWGLRSQNLSFFSCPTPIEDQTDNSLQDYDISVPSINHKPASLIFKIRLNIIKENPFISMKCPKSEIPWPKSPFV